MEIAELVQVRTLVFVAYQITGTDRNHSSEMANALACWLQAVSNAVGAYQAKIASRSVYTRRVFVDANHPEASADVSTACADGGVMLSRLSSDYTYAEAIVDGFYFELIRDQGAASVSAVFDFPQVDLEAAFEAVVCASMEPGATIRRSIGEYPIPTYNLIALSPIVLADDLDALLDGSFDSVESCAGNGVLGVVTERHIDWQ